MSFLPDEIWSKILEMVAASNRLSFRDLCSVAMTCRRHNRLSGDPSIWSILLALDFPQSVSSSSSSPAIPFKSLYRNRFERDKARRIAAWKRAILIAESQVSVCMGRLKELECLLRKEGERLMSSLEELNNLERIRRASVALNVWQPELVLGSQRQMVEQCTVPIDCRLSNLKMEVDLCKQQIAIYKNAYNEQKKRLRKSNETLTSHRYNPLETYLSGVSRNDSGAKRKKMTWRASVALNVWQPGLVLGSQRQMVEQCTVPIDWCVSNLKMEVDLCKQQIAIYKNAYNEQNKRLRELSCL